MRGKIVVSYVFWHTWPGYNFDHKIQETDRQLLVLTATSGLLVLTHFHKRLQQLFVFRPVFYFRSYRIIAGICIIKYCINPLMPNDL
jgi:hypothetical protein